MRRLSLFLLGLVLLAPAVAFGDAQPVHPQPMPVAKADVPAVGLPGAKADVPAKKFARGLVSPVPAVLELRHEAAFKRHGHRMKSLPTATPASFDCRAMGWVGPMLDQGQCGSCWDVSGCDCITSAFIKAGLAKNDGSFAISAQFILDQCGYSNDGCNGDDSVNVIAYAQKSGIPCEQDYGPYTAQQGRCKSTNAKRYKIDGSGYCTPSQQSGMASTQDIKNAMVQFGPISTAIAADSSWDGATPSGVIPYRRLTPNDIDHDVQLVGWDDARQIPGAPAKGAWIMKNQWSEQWGDKGYGYLAYGSHQIGTEAMWVSVAALPPAPVPPGPTPVPPGPGPVPPAPGTGFTGTLTYSNGTLVTVTPGDAGPATGPIDTTGLPLALIVDLAKLAADVRAKATVQVLFADVLQIFADLPK